MDAGLIARRLDAALKTAGVPILGVSIKSAEDRASWAATYTDAATKAERIAGDALIARFDPGAPEVIAAEEVKDAESLVTPMLQAFYLWYFRDKNKRDPTAEERATDLGKLVQAFRDVA